MGEDLASMAFPLGTEKNHLLVGAEDALAMQEIQFQKDEIREKVNVWLGNEYFEDVRISLMFWPKSQGRFAGSPDWTGSGAKPGKAARKCFTWNIS